MSPNATTRKKILVIDDEPAIVEYLETLLTDNGYETVSAANGVEGLKGRAVTAHPRPRAGRSRRPATRGCPRRSRPGGGSRGDR